MTAVLPLEIVDAVLRVEGETLVRRVEWFAELGSTNDYALAAVAAESLEIPRLIWAERQTAGRGRSAHPWWAANGALTFSLIVDEAATGLTAALWPQVSVLTGLAVAQALGRFLPEHVLGLKWPNDVQAHGRKISGILVEVPPKKPQRLVIGVGINVANSVTSAPPDLQSIATALADLIPASPAPVAVLLAFLKEWEALTRSLAAQQLDLPARWSRHCVLENRRVRVTSGDRVLEGVCRGIDADGALRLETGTGILRQLGGTVRAVDRG